MRRAKMRERLIVAGAKVIAEKGAEKVTIDDFISEAHVSRGTFYNYFATREEMLGAIWNSRGHDPFEYILASCRGLANPAEHLSAVTRLVLRKARLDPVWGWLTVALSADATSLNDDLRQYPVPDLLAGMTAEVFVFSDLQAAADMVVGTVRAGLKALLNEKRDTGYAESVTLMILLALGVPRKDAERIARATLAEV